MSKLPVNLDDVVEPTPAAAGRYDLTITGAELAYSGEKSKNPGSPQLIVNIQFPEEVNAPGMRQYISLPAEGDEKKSSDFKALLLKRFLVAFKIPFQPDSIDPEELALTMPGQTANLEVKQDPPTETGDIYNRLVVPKLPNEGQPGRTSPPRRR